MRILGVPFHSAAGEVAANVARALTVIRAAVQQAPVDVVVLPELFTCGYCAKCLAPWAEPVGGPTMQQFTAAATELGVLIGYGFAEAASQDRVYNSWALVGRGLAPQVYRKTHLHPAAPDSPENEPAFLLPGPLLAPLSTPLGLLGVMICYDGCFVEVPRTLALQGADVILWPTRSGTYLASQGLARVRAFDNVIPVVQIEGGQTGPYLPLRSWSMVCAEDGEVLVSQQHADTPIRIELDLDRARALRWSGDRGARSLFRPRRPELYGPLTQL